ncbi:MAG TPA: hypothetical protein VII06_03480 [Chloroflexota bacterium]|jgi:hypothetical protein
MAYALLAEVVHIDPSAGKFYVIGGGIDTIMVPSAPAQLNSIALLCILEADAAQAGTAHDVTLVVTGPGGGELGSSSANVQFGPAPPAPTWPLQVPVSFQFHNFPVAGPGEYGFRVAIDNVVLGSVGLLVRPWTPPS